MKYVLESDNNNYELMGGKATALSKIGKVLSNIPNWFVVAYTGFNKETKSIEYEAEKEIEQKLEEFSDNDYFAVRSSAGNEDSSDNSFAGQFDTFLYVKKQDVIQKICDVYLSAFSERIDTYRKENNIEEIMIPSVIVQRMVNSEKSGVAFGANPVNSNIKQVVVSAVFGLGSGLVDGIATADTYKIENNKIEKEIVSKDFMHVLDGRDVIQKEVSKEQKSIQVLTDKQILEVKDLVKKSSEFFGRYQDIEWAYEGGKLYLLQSRPITTLTNSKEGKINVFDNSNIVESYGGITTPLTFSFIRMVYENVYIELCKIFNVKQEKIEMNSSMFKNMLALIDGRVYYNLYGWYGLLSMFPGLGSNKKFMEQMMGVKESLPDDLFPVPQATFKDKVGLINTGWGLVKGFLKIRKMTDKFYDRLNDALEDKDINSMDLYELHDYYYELEKKLLHKWDAPLVNDFLAMIFYGQLKEQCKELFQEEGNMVHNDLLCDEGGIISSEPAKRIKQMAKIAKDNEELIKLLENKDFLYVQKELPKYEEFNKMLNEYLDKFADRCLEELKLETLTLRDNPASLYSSIATFAKRIKEKGLEEIDERKNRENAEKRVREKLRFKFTKKAKFDFILKQARYTVKNRENLRFERTRLFGRVRELFLRIGFILTSMNVIEDKRDIFYLEVDEILFYIDGKSTTNNLKDLIAIRKEQYLKYQNMSPDDRFYSYGAVNIGNSFKRESNVQPGKKSKLELKGIGASPGKVTGRVRVIRNPEKAKLEQGEILVAEFTDPGWIMLFPAASGILVERGSLLSHSAIVSRELRIPAVVGITGLIDTLKDGDIVELDGTSGIVKVKNQEIRNLRELLYNSADEYGEKILYPEKNITYREFKERVTSLFGYLADEGFKNIAILSENRYEWELTFFAIVCSGKNVIPIDKSLPKDEIENIINSAKIEVVFCSEKYENELKEIKENNQYLKSVISFESNDFTTFISQESRELDSIEIQDDDNCAIIFTSGTTKNPKGIMLTHKNICSNIVNVSKVFEITQNDKCLSVVPLNHVLEGLFCFLQSFYKGAERVFCNELDEIIEYIKKYNITFMGAVPAIYKYLFKQKDELKKEANHINMFMSGGSKIEEYLIEGFKEIGIQLVQGYGLTESSPVVSIENKNSNKIGSVGRILPGVKVAIKEQDKNGIGEIIVKGENITKGYFENVEETKNTIIDGWLHTGDLGKIDEEGYLFICGRNKDLIILENGKKIFPSEIENLLNKIENVKESFVYEKNNKLYAKLVYLKDEFANKTEDEIYGVFMKNIKDVNETLPQFKKISDIVLSTEELEKTITGKIKRNAELDKTIKQESIDNSENNEDTHLGKIKNILTKQLGNKEINLESELVRDLGADSLDLVEIFLSIEKEFDIKITKEQRMGAKKVKDILDIMKNIEKQ